MTGLSDLLATAGPPERTPARPTHPKGWEPGIAWDGATGTITTEPLADAPIWAELIADWGFDPGAMEVVDGSIEVIGWDSPVKGTKTGEKIRLKRYKARLVKRGGTTDRPDVDALCAAIMKRKPKRQNRTVTGTDLARALVVCLSDWQVGKGEGDGSAGTVDRILSAIDAVAARVKELAKCGRPVGAVYFLGMGDLVEQCAGNYPSQAFTVDLDRREQMRVARRLCLAAVDAVLDVPLIVFAAVPGNHGENRNGDGKAYTTITDNDDLAVVEQLGEILSANPARYGHVSVVTAKTPDLTLDIAGIPVAFRHGHIGGRGAHSAAKIEEWWRGQALGRQPAADAQILVSAHYHHLLMSEATGRTVLQCPAMDPGSAWFTQATGSNSPAGMLTFAVGEAYGPRGWGDLEVL